MSDQTVEAQSALSEVSDPKVEEADTENNEPLQPQDGDKTNSSANSLLDTLKLSFEMSPRPRIRLYTVDQYNASLSQRQIKQASNSTSAEEKEFCSCESSRENYYAGPIHRALELKRLMNRKKKLPPKLTKAKRSHSMKKPMPAVKAKRMERRNLQLRQVQQDDTATSEPETEAASEVGILTTFPPNSVAGAQAAIGCTFGCIGGIIDHAFSDRYGILIGCSLVALQAIDRRAGQRLPWNRGLRGHVRESKHTKDCTMGKLVEEVTAFTVDNAYMATGFAGGYLLGTVIADACRNIN